jgi:serine protease AprX
MQRLLYFLVFTSSIQHAFTQDYFIGFKDKDSFDSVTTIQFLSQRSMDRRDKQNISLDSSDSPVNQTYIDSISKLGLKAIYTSKWLNGILVNTSNEALINQVKNIEFVSYVHNIQKTSVAGGIQTFDSSEYGTNLNAINFFNIQGFHQKGNLGQGKLIAVIDAGFTGVDTSSAFSSLNLIDEFNFFNPSKSIYNTNSSHGTNVVSILSAKNSNQFIGFAPEAELALYTTENISNESIVEEYYWLFAAERADSLGADIINSSLGYFDFDFASTNHTFEQLDGNTSIITKAANLVSKKGILVVSSSGNSHASVDWPHINFPSDAELALTVGSIDGNGEVSSFSSRGPINNTYYKPELVAPGTNVSILTSAGKSSTSSGTSFTAPMISGLASLVWNEYPNLTAQEIKQLLIESASNYQTPNQDLGYGYPQIGKILNTNQTDNTEIKNIKKSFYFDTLGREYEGIPTKTGVYLQKILYLDDSLETKRIYIN